MEEVFHPAHQYLWQAGELALRSYKWELSLPLISCSTREHAQRTFLNPSLATEETEMVLAVVAHLPILTAEARGL